jgi:hypothetical protein
VIHAFALEPKLVATWGKREEFRFIHDKFGLGTPRALLELPAFSKWKRAVYTAANDLGLSQEDMKRLEELFRLFGEHKCRRADSVYDGLIGWLENAEREYERRPFAGVVAAANPRNHGAVLIADQLGANRPRWACDSGASPARTPEALAGVLSPMLSNCRQLHLVDPHFGPENARHRKVLESLMNVLAAGSISPDVIRLHCGAETALSFFEQEAAKMAGRLPDSLVVEFVRWSPKTRGEKLHNRYVLTDLGGVTLGVGLDEGKPGETDDLLLLPRAQFERRWAQYVEMNGAFERADMPASVRGTRPIRALARGR